MDNTQPPAIAPDPDEPVTIEEIALQLEKAAAIERLDNVLSHLDDELKLPITATTAAAQYAALLGLYATAALVVAATLCTTYIWLVALWLNAHFLLLGADLLRTTMSELAPAPESDHATVEEDAGLSTTDLSAEKNACEPDSQLLPEKDAHVKSAQPLREAVTDRATQAEDGADSDSAQSSRAVRENPFGGDLSKAREFLTEVTKHHSKGKKSKPAPHFPPRGFTPVIKPVGPLKVAAPPLPADFIPPHKRKGLESTAKKRAKQEAVVASTLPSQGAHAPENVPPPAEPSRVTFTAAELRALNSSSAVDDEQSQQIASGRGMIESCNPIAQKEMELEQMQPRASDDPWPLSADGQRINMDSPEVAASYARNNPDPPPTKQTCPNAWTSTEISYEPPAKRRPSGAWTFPERSPPPPPPKSLLRKLSEPVDAERMREMTLPWASIVPLKTPPGLSKAVPGLQSDFDAILQSDSIKAEAQQKSSFNEEEPSKSIVSPVLPTESSVTDNRGPDSVVDVDKVDEQREADDTSPQQSGEGGPPKSTKRQLTEKKKVARCALAIAWGAREMWRRRLVSNGFSIADSTGMIKATSVYNQCRLDLAALMADGRLHDNDEKCYPRISELNVGWPNVGPQNAEHLVEKARKHHKATVAELIAPLAESPILLAEKSVYEARRLHMEAVDRDANIRAVGMKPSSRDVKSLERRTAHYTSKREKYIAVVKDAGLSDDLYSNYPAI
ncbi:hypothetical protein Slin14017_G000150 [Septoria linicola]|nr:hypothetical protein Slin14017_G000150 [Septoria linicola]